MIVDVLSTIGKTPLVRLNNITSSDESEVVLKYEKVNPGGSIKDRPANYIIMEAERRGLLKPGGTIIESSSGNFGVSLAMIGAAKGYRIIILVDPKTTETNLALLKCFGAEVIVVTEKDDCGSYHKTRISLANRLSMEIKNSFRPDQCFSLLNSEAHYKSTAREIIDDCAGAVDMIIAPVSTGGQLGGISNYIKNYYPHIQIVGVDAEGSAIFGGTTHSYLIPGIGLGWTPENLQLSKIDCAYKVSDEDAYMAARTLAKHEGILMGPSSGACIIVALRFSKILGAGKRIVSMMSDGAERYIQTLFNDKWLIENGFSLTTSIEELKERAKKLQAWSTCPCERANYQSALKSSLEIPSTTACINSDLVKSVPEMSDTSFLD